MPLSLRSCMASVALAVTFTLTNAGIQCWRRLCPCCVGRRGVRPERRLQWCRSPRNTGLPNFGDDLIHMSLAVKMTDTVQLDIFFN